jgi:hypothetical protein
MATGSDGAPNVQNDASFEEYGCRIDRDLLNRIIQVIKKDFAQETKIHISTTRKGRGISSNISADSVDGLLDALRQSTLPGDPTWMDNLNISMDEYQPGASRRVSVRFRTYSVSGTVTGGDPG